MAKSSILGGAHTASQPSGTDVDALGPSDSSDSGSDVQTDRGRSAAPDESSEGALPIAHDSTSDASGTGERGVAEGNDVESGSDISADRIGIVPEDAAEAASVIDDPDAASLDELAIDDDKDGDADEDDGDDESDLT